MIAIKKQIVCPLCKETSQENIVITADKSKDERVTAGIIDASLFYSKCKYCDMEINLVYPFLYIDPKNKAVIYYLPNLKSDKLLFKKTYKSFPQLKGYKKRIVGTHEELREKVMILESNLDDKVIERLKYSIYKRLSKEQRDKFKNMYFCMSDIDRKRISFIITLENNKTVYYTVSLLAYTKSEIYIDKYRLSKEDPKYFTRINFDWIKNIVNEKRDKLKAEQDKKEPDIKSKENAASKTQAAPIKKKHSGKTLLTKDQLLYMQQTRKHIFDFDQELQKKLSDEDLQEQIGEQEKQDISSTDKAKSEQVKVQEEESKKIEESKALSEEQTKQAPAEEVKTKEAVEKTEDKQK
ncbi:MAG: CpXC domain-containing protein [Clostridia bacterium]|nr:CpXC domain-containing protein [Clostridia bacterium]